VWAVRRSAEPLRDVENRNRMDPSALTPSAAPGKGRLFNRNVLGMGCVSLLSDFGHEMVTVSLPGFLAVLGLSAGTLGVVEGVADSIASIAKLGGGWLADRMSRRKPLAVGGYALTAATNGLFALARAWPLILFSRCAAWVGRGIRSPAKKAILASSVPPENLGKAFGFERAGDTTGAILGPLLSVTLLAHFEAQHSIPSHAFRTIFLISVIPGMAAALAFGLMIRETPRARQARHFVTGLRGLPTRFRRFLVGVGLFGMGDYARTLMILAATELLTPRFGVTRAAAVAGMLYLGHNCFYAAASYPVGAVSDRIGRRGLLAAGYACGGLSALGFAGAFYFGIRGITYLLLLFGLAGISIAVYDSLEDAITADLISEQAWHGSAFGLLGAVNGAGDLVASIVTGLLWSKVSPALAFTYGGLCMGIGGGVIAWNSE
jgi:MFS family permease